MYPYFLWDISRKIAPIFGVESIWHPCIIDYSLPAFQKLNPRDQGAVEQYNNALMKSTHTKWALGWYLEDRSYILTDTHIKKEGRIYHLGVDIIFHAGTMLYSPLAWIVYERWYEEGDGNYGWYIIIEYPTIWNNSFFVLYGHLSYQSISQKIKIGLGEWFACLGTKEENGNWFEHLHMQVFTGKDIEKWKSKWYCSLNDMKSIKYYCPDPSFLIRY